MPVALGVAVLSACLPRGLCPDLKADPPEEEKKALFLKHHQPGEKGSGSSPGKKSPGHKKSSAAGEKHPSKGSSKHSSKSSPKGAAHGSPDASPKGAGKGKKGRTSTPHHGSATRPADHSGKDAGASATAAPAASLSPQATPDHVVAKGDIAPTAAAAAIAATGLASAALAATPAREAVPPSAGERHSPVPGASPALHLPLPHGAEPSAPITIEKSGLETSTGLEPAPVQTGGGFWGRFFGSKKSYAYLGGSVRSAIDRAPVRRGRWKYIVVHNSGTREGNARVFDIYHRRVRHMQNGLAYHFVIGDGHGSGDGEIEIGHRWTAQLNGGHVASDYLNDIALGICLVGDFNRDLPTKAQMGALEELVTYLRERVGKSQGRRAIIHAHKEINPRPTDCPGDRFPYDWLHAKFGTERRSAP